MWGWTTLGRGQRDRRGGGMEGRTCNSHFHELTCSERTSGGLKERLGDGMGSVVQRLRSHPRVRRIRLKVPDLTLPGHKKLSAMGFPQSTAIARQSTMSTTAEGVCVALVLIVIELPGPSMPSVQQEYKIFTAPYSKSMLTRSMTVPIRDR